MIDLTLCAKRVTQIINAATRDGSGNITFVTTVEDARRNETNISTAVLEAAKLVAEAICETDSHPDRAPFVALTAATHGATLPPHTGTPGRPQIQAYSGASWKAGEWRPASEIESFRENPSSIYDAIDHDAEGSSLGGFYDFVGDALYFTGYAARVPLATFTDDDVASKLPAASAAKVIQTAVGLVKTEGDSGTLDGYGAQGLAERQQIRSKGEPVKSVEAVAR